MTFIIFLSIVGLSTAICSLSALLVTLFYDFKADESQKKNFDLMKWTCVKGLFLGAAVSAVAKKETVEYLLYMTF